MIERGTEEKITTENKLTIMDRHLGAVFTEEQEDSSDGKLHCVQCKEPDKKKNQNPL